MKSIRFPLELGAQDRHVADLQLALSENRKGKAVLAGGERRLQELQSTLSEEISRVIFSPATQKLTFIFQDEHDVPPQSLVDEAMAAALSVLIQNGDILARFPLEFQTSLSFEEYIVPCQVLCSGNRPLAVLRTEVFDQDPKLHHDTLTRSAVTEEYGITTIRSFQSEFMEHPGERGS